VELQENLARFEAKGIWICAISYDSVAVLRQFAERHNITYPLLSDVESRVIRQFGIFNTHIPKGHRWYGVPFPGTFMVNESSTVIDKSFYANHGVRDSVAQMLAESFEVRDANGKIVQTVKTDLLKATASLSSGTIRRGQVQMFRLDMQLNSGHHIYARPLPDGYIPTTLTFQEVEGIRFGEVIYPEPRVLHLEKLNESLPFYDGRVVLKASVRNSGRRTSFAVKARLEYQVCDDRECYPPEQIDFEIPVTYLDNV
jgi:peroxiredoxin